MTTAAPSAPPAREALQGAAQAGRGHPPSIGAGGPSPASVRPRSRPTPAAPPDDDPRDDDAALERMRAALRMAAEGKTQPEIAAHFGVTDRTIRAWLAKARELRLGTFRRFSAEEALAEAEESLRALEAVAHAHLRAATTAGYGRQTVLWVREIADLIERRLSLHGRIGAFDHLRQDREAERDRRQDAAMGVIRPGVFEYDAAWGVELDRRMAGVGSLPAFDAPVDRSRGAADAEADRALAARGIDVVSVRALAESGIAARLAEEVFGPDR